jgi:hypothetical protein
MDGDFDGHKAWYQGMAKALRKRPQIGIGISNGGNTTSIKKRQHVGRTNRMTMAALHMCAALHTFDHNNSLAPITSTAVQQS